MIKKEIEKYLGLKIKYNIGDTVVIKKDSYECKCIKVGKINSIRINNNRDEAPVLRGIKTLEYSIDGEWFRERCIENMN